MARGNFGRNGGRNAGRNGGRNGGRNAKDKRVQTTSTDEIVGNISATSQDEVGGNSRTSTQDVLVENNEMAIVNEVAAETNADHNSEESETLNEGIHNEAENGAVPSIYEHLNAKRTINGRQVIRVFANELYPSCARSIREIFGHRVDISGCCWARVTTETKKFYFEEFRKRFYWDEAIEELVKIAWEKKANSGYSGMLSRANKHKKRLQFVPQDIWDEWQKYFCSEEFLRKSRRNSENRKGGKDGPGPSCHTGGSIPHVEHAIRYAKELGRDPNLYELFLKTHARKHDGQMLVDDKARKTNERVLSLRQRRVEQQEDSTQVLDENEIFIEAATGKRRDRVYGIGSVASLVGKNSSSTSAPSPSTAYTAQLEKEVETLHQKFGNMQEEITQLRQQVSQRDDERLRELIREMFPNCTTNQTGSSSERRAPDSQS